MMPKYADLDQNVLVMASFNEDKRMSVLMLLANNNISSVSFVGKLHSKSTAIQL
jgi:hypothetical protein